MQYLGVFSVAGAVFLLYLIFVAGVAHNTHIHINRTLTNFFPDIFLPSHRFYQKPIHETNFATCSVFFILIFCSDRLVTNLLKPSDKQHAQWGRVRF